MFTYFTLLSNPDAIYLIMAMPSLMILFLTLLVSTVQLGAMQRILSRCKSYCSVDAEDRRDTEAAVLSLAAEVCHRYRLIADYFQRPQMNEIFARKTDELRKQSVPEAVAGVNDEPLSLPLRSFKSFFDRS